MSRALRFFQPTCVSSSAMDDGIRTSVYACNHNQFYVFPRGNMEARGVARSFLTLLNSKFQSESAVFVPTLSSALFRCFERYSGWSLFDVRFRLTTDADAFYSYEQRLASRLRVSATKPGSTLGNETPAKGLVSVIFLLLFGFCRLLPPLCNLLLGSLCRYNIYVFDSVQVSL